MKHEYYFIKRKGEKVIYTYKVKPLHRAIYILSTMFWVPLPLILIGVILPLTKTTPWTILFLFVGLAIFSYIVAFISSFVNKEIEYIFTNKAVIKLTGDSYYNLPYENIKSVKYKHSIFNKKIGMIKFEVSDGKSYKYNLPGIENDVYQNISNIIIDNSHSSFL